MITSQAEQAFARARAQMVERQLRNRDIHDARILEVLGRTPRHRFVTDPHLPQAYDDRPLPIGHGQTISQPYIVALSTQLARPLPGDRALDVGTGSGYQAAILAELVERVISVEIIPSLAEDAAQRLSTLGYHNVAVRCDDGTRGSAAEAPFDVIIAAAAPPQVPVALLEQLAPGGRLVMPVGTLSQDLMLFERELTGELRRTNACPVRFVPMISGG